MRIILKFILFSKYLDVFVGKNWVLIEQLPIASKNSLRIQIFIMIILTIEG